MSGYTLRRPKPGDLGWIVHRHGVLYAEDYGWNEAFEAEVATIVADFVRQFDPERDRAWIAERDGAIVGCVMVVKGAEDTAKLRVLLVEPSARGLGLGRRLVEECVQFARAAGYQKMVLWTSGDLTAARRIYAQAGFRLIHAEPVHSFGHDWSSETWELWL